MFRWLLIVALLGLVAGCGGDGASKAKVYDIRGKVAEIDPARPEVKLDHEDIPGFMKAMVMTFPVENTTVVEGLQKGDLVQGKLRVEGGKYTITELKKR